MKPTPFIAADADSALKQVQEAFGPDAVVVSVRRLPAHGISKLWHAHGQIEVLACPPQSQPVGPRVHTVPQGMNAYVPFADELVVDLPAPRPPRRWHSLSWLESMGLMPEMADRLEHELEAKHGTELPPTPITEWNAVRDIIAAHWLQPPLVEYGTGRPHVFIGPPGSGKTTALCKWMTQVVLAEDHSVHVWRLDGAGANTSEFLSLHCEMMGVPVERFWAVPEALPDLMFLDLPGVEMHDPVGLRALREVLSALPLPHVHLVLNAAYHGTILFEQFRSFAPLGIEDIIFTHLDEDPQRVKLWNFVLGTNCTVSFLGAGQKIPGDFRRAESALLFPHGKAL